MLPSDDLRVVLVTVPSAALADSLARELVEARLAACVNVVPGLVSHYYWDGVLQKDAELMLIIKTRAAALDELGRFVRERHTAKVPEIIALPIQGGDPGYLRWLADSTLP
jgi:periplasmic divalent cation tolerance protein